MPSVMTWLLLAVLLYLSGAFSGMETALFSLTKLEKRRLTETHPRMAKWVLMHLENPRRTLITILVGNLFVNTFAATTVTYVALHTWGPSAVGLVVVVFTLVLVLFGEIMPKTFAVRHNEWVAMTYAIPLRIFSILIFPIRRATRMITDMILSWLIPEKKEHPDQISEDELKTLVKIGEEEGVLDRDERHMIHKVFELGERQVKDIMTPRVDIMGLDLEDSPEKHLERMRKYHFSHFPVYKESLDNMQGILSVQEYMLSPKKDLHLYLQEPLFVPEAKRVDDLLAEFRKKGKHFAICVDEFGGTAGLVTLEDILEQVFGEVYDEYAKVETPIRFFGHQEYLVDAKIPLADFNEHFSSHLESQEASTLGGFILEKLGQVPEKDEVLQTPGLEIRIYDVMRKRRIRSVIVRPKK